MTDKLLVEVQLITCAVPIIAEVGQRIMVLGNVAVGVDTATRASPKALPAPKPSKGYVINRGDSKIIRRSKQDVDAENLRILECCKDKARSPIEIRKVLHLEGSSAAQQTQISKLHHLYKYLSQNGRGQYQTNSAGLAALEKGELPPRGFKAQSHRRKAA